MNANHLRPYQVNAVDAVFREWEKADATLLNQATGTGKTVEIAEVVRRCQPKRALILAHRRELVRQAHDKFEKFTKLDAEIEMAHERSSFYLFSKCHAVVSSVQSQTPGRRSKPTDFDILVIDECFPAGTIVSGRPIESYSVGMRVDTHLGTGIVGHVFRRKASELLRITFSDGRRITCTPNHPVWANGKFVPAQQLTIGSMVLTIIRHEHMQHLPSRNTIRKEALRGQEMPVAAQQKHHSNHVRQARRGNNPIQKNERHVTSGGKSQGVSQIESHGLEAGGSRRERSRAYSSRAGIGSSPGVEHECSNPNSHSQGAWLSDLLQGGCWELGPEVCHRDRWRFALRSVEKGSGLKKGRILAFARVVGVEVFKCGDRQRFTEVCPDGFVYNLEVSNGNTYFANGVLVHNCHHIRPRNKSYMDVINHYKQNPNLKILGVTATPEPECMCVFKSIAYTYDIHTAITEGYLVDIDPQMVTIHGLDYSHIRTTAGDLNGADLAAVLEAEKVCQGMIVGTLEVMFGVPQHSLNPLPIEQWGAFLHMNGKPRRNLVFTVSVAQAKMMSDIFNRVQPGMSAWVCGDVNLVSEEKRRQIGHDFNCGKIQIVCNCGVYSEGYDNPGIEMVTMARPTKSLTLFTQQIGRGTRTLEGLIDGIETVEDRLQAIAASTKKNLIVLDFAGNCGRHKLISSVDLMGGKFPEEVKDRVRAKLNKSDKPQNIRALLEKTREEIEAEKAERDRQEQARKNRLVIKSTYSITKVSAFDKYQVKYQRSNYWDRQNGRILSEKQRNILRGMDVNPDDVSYSCGRKLIAAHFNQPPTTPQIAVLKRAKYSDEEISKFTKRTAIQEISTLAANNWHRKVIDDADVPQTVEQPS